MARDVQKAISIPEPTNEVDSLWKTAQSLKEAVEVIQGIRGNREYALKCDLDDIGDTVTTVVSGGGVGITSFANLTDTDLVSQTQYDLVFNADGLEWQNTAAELIWNPTLDYLQLANAHSINWLDEAAASIELLNFQDLIIFSADFSDVEVYLDFDGTDGDTTFTDFDGNAWTFVGAQAELSNTKVKFGSTSFTVGTTNDASSSINSGGTINLSNFAGDFTIEIWYYGEGASWTGGNTLVTQDTDLGAAYSWRVALNGGVLVFQYNTTNQSTSEHVFRVFGGVSHVANQWNHVVIERESGVLAGYYNGVQQGSTIADASLIYSGGAGDINVIDNGNYGSVSDNTYADDVRIQIGSARYGGPFTPPTEAGGPAIGAETFIVGDHFYATQIDGLTTKISSADTTIEGTVDIDGTLNVDGAATFISTMEIKDDLDLTEGAILTIWDSTNTDNVMFSHDGTDFNIVPTTTANLNIGGFTDSIVITDPVRIVGLTDILQLTAGQNDGTFLGTQIQFSHEGSELYQQAIGTRHHSAQDGGNAIDFYLWDFGVDADTSVGTYRVFALDQTGSDLFSALDMTGLLTQGVGTVDLVAHNNFFDLVAVDMATDPGYYLRSGTVDVILQLETSTGDFTITNESSDEWRFSTDGFLSTIGLQVEDTGGTDFARFSHDGTDFLTDFTLTADWVITGLVGGDMHLDGSLIVDEDLTVSGTLTSINTSDLNIADNVFILNSDEVGAPSQNAGMEVERGTSLNVQVIWNETSDKWTLTEDGSNWYDIITANDIPTGGLIVDGTVNDSILRWSGAAWIEETAISIDASGDIFTTGWLEVQGTGAGGGSVAINIANAIPRMAFEETDAAVDNQVWYAFANGEQFHISAVNDIRSVVTDAIVINRTGTVIDNMTLTGVVNTSSNVNATGALSGTHVRTGDGSVGTPAHSFIGENGTGMYLTAAGSLGFSTLGDLTARFNNNGLLQLYDPGGTNSMYFHETGSQAQWVATDSDIYLFPQAVQFAHFSTTSLNLNAQAASPTSINIGEGTTLRGDGQDAVIQFFGEHTGVIYGSQLSQTSSVFNLLGVGGNPATDFQIQMNVDILGGDLLRIRSSDNSDFAVFSHDLTDFNTDFTTTTDWNIDGVAAIRYTSGLATADITVGRNANEYFQLGVDDAHATLRLVQDETDATEHTMDFDISSANVGGLREYRWKDNGTARMTLDILTGDLTLSGTVDGRDIDADGTTLDTHVALVNEHLDWTLDTGSVIQVDNLAPDVDSVTPNFPFIVYDRSAANINYDDFLDSGIFGDGGGTRTNQPANGTFNPFMILRNSSDVRVQLSVPYQNSETIAWRGYLTTFRDWHYAAWTTNEPDADLSLYAKTADVVADGTTNNSTLSWSGSAWIEETTVLIPTSGVLQLSDGSPHLRFEETDAGADEKLWYMGCTGVDDFLLQTRTDVGGAGATIMEVNRTGVTPNYTMFPVPFRIADTGQTDWAEFSHDDTDFNMVATNTTDWNISGITRIFNAGTMTSTSNTNTDGDNFFVTTSNKDSTLWAYGVERTVLAYEAGIFMDGRMKVHSTAGGDGLRVYDEGDTDYGLFHHDGTDFNTALINTVDWNVTTMTGNFNLVNYSFDVTQTVGVGQDNFVLTYDNGTGLISLEAAAGGSQTPWASDIDGGGFGLDNIDRLEIQAPAIPGDSATFTHDGTNFATDFLNTSNWNIDGITNGIALRNGMSLSIYDSTDIDQIDISHDGTDALINCFQTTALQIMNGVALRIQNSTNLDWTAMFHDGTDFHMAFVNTTDFNIGTDGGGSTPTATKVWSDLYVMDGQNFRVYDGTDSDYVQFFHSGTNLEISESGTTAIVFPAAGTLDFDLTDNALVAPVITDYAIESFSQTITANAATLSFSVGPAFELDLAAATADVTVTISGGPPAGTYGELIVKVTQDTTAREITWAGGTFNWQAGVEPTMSPGSTAIDIFHFSTWDGGTTWWGTVAQDMQ